MGSDRARPVDGAAPQSINDRGWMRRVDSTSTMAQHAFLLTDGDEFIDLGPGSAW